MIGNVRHIKIKVRRLCKVLRGDLFRISHAHAFVHLGARDCLRFGWSGVCKNKKRLNIYSNIYISLETF